MLSKRYGCYGVALPSIFRPRFLQVALEVFTLFELSRSPVLVLAIFDPNVHHLSINPSLVSAFLMGFVLSGFG